MYVEKTFTPQQLFEMVWERPVLIIAKEIGVSDVGLSKACRKAGITYRRSWAEVAQTEAAGITVTRAAARTRKQTEGSESGVR
ncbi:hypothetical protein ACTORR_04380 [Pseudomonas sp. SAR267]